MAGSIVTSVGMQELVTSDLPSYERTAVTLASDPVRLAALRRRLQESRDTCPLFDTPRFTRNLEKAYDGLLAPSQGGVSHREGRS